MKGRVVAKKMEKSVTVIVERLSVHPLYKKAFKRSKKFLVDDPIGVAMGDLVEIIKVAPVSKRKQFRVVKILGKQLVQITAEKLKKQAKQVIEEVMPEEKIGNRVQGISEASISSGNVGSSKETKEAEIKKKRVRKEKLVPKP